MAVKNVRWMRELDSKTAFECMLSWPDGTKADYIEKMREAAAQVFAKVHEFPYPDSTERTWPAGANWAWQSVARWIPMITNYKGNTYPFEKVIPDGTPWLFLEADAVPLKPGWMTTLAEEYKRGGKPFMGHIVKEMGHMNGVAIYPNDVSRWARDAFHAVHSAWDVMLKEQTIDQTHRANHLIQHCWVLINGQCSHNGDGIIATFRDTGEMYRLIEKDAVLFHRTKDGSLIDCLMQTRVTLSNNSSQSTQNENAAPDGQRNTRKAEDSKPASGIILPTVPPVPVMNPDDLDTPTSRHRETAVDDFLAKSEPFKKYVEAVASSTPDEYTTEKFPKTEIFIVTYYKDSEFLKYCLYSIKEFATGFTGVTVACPDRDIEIIEPVCREWGPENLTLEPFTEVEGKGMLNHMAIECMAEQFCLNCDFVLHFDSDCIFIEKVTPADYFKGGKPVLLMEAYERFKDKHPGVLRWQTTTEQAIGKPVTHEFMRRHPAVHYVGLYPKARAMVEQHVKKPFMEWALSGQNQFPQSWSEYNVLGAVAWELFRDKYAWIDTGHELPPKDKLVQFWSHGGLDRKTDTGPFVPQTPRAVIKKILGV